MYSEGERKKNGHTGCFAPRAPVQRIQSKFLMPCGTGTFKGIRRTHRGPSALGR